MEKNELEVKDLAEHHESLFSRLSKRTAAGKLEDVLETSKSQINSVFEELTASLTEFDPGLKNVVESTRKKVDHQVNILCPSSFD